MSSKLTKYVLFLIYEIIYDVIDFKKNLIWFQNLKLLIKKINVKN